MRLAACGACDAAHELLARRPRRSVDGALSTAPCRRRSVDKDDAGGMARARARAPWRVDEVTRHLRPRRQLILAAAVAAAAAIGAVAAAALRRRRLLRPARPAGRGAVGICGVGLDVACVRGA